MNPRQLLTNGGPVGELHTMLCVEPLENRFALSGNIVASLVDGNLWLQGDELDNNVSIEVADNQIVVVGNGDTTINGGNSPFVVSSGNTFTGNIFARLRQGDDQLSTGTGLNVEGTVRFNTGSGQDRVVTNGLVATERLVVTTGSGDDSITVNEGQFGGLFVFSGSGSDDVTIEDTVVDGNVVITTGTQDDRLAINDVQVNGYMVTVLGAGDDSIQLDDTTVEGWSALHMNSGDDVIQFLGDSSLTGPARVFGGGGNDQQGIAESVSGELLRMFSFVDEPIDLPDSTPETPTPATNDFLISEETASKALVGTVQPSSALSDNVFFDFQTPDTVNEALQLVIDDHIKGDLDAPVVIIEYIDLQCPVCRSYHTIVNNLVEQYSEEVMVVSRHLPLTSIHPNAFEAALFAEAAAQQGAFDEMVDILFERQDDWASLDDPTTLFEQYATEIGLNLGEVTAAVADPATSERVTRDLDAATQELGLSSTPSFFINNERVPLSEISDEEAFSASIQSAINQDTSRISLNRRTGELRVEDSERLDFESSPNFSFNVIATDGANSETITVDIELTDVVDESQISELPAGAVVTTEANGLQYFDLESGDGASPLATDRVRVAYVGYLPNGDIFDSNSDADFLLSNLIQGFSEGVQGMQVGGTRRIIIPPDLGYGNSGNPRANIGGTDTIVFDVTLREVIDGST